MIQREKLTWYLINILVENEPIGHLRLGCQIMFSKHLQNILKDCSENAKAEKELLKEMEEEISEEEDNADSSDSGLLSFVVLLRFYAMKMLSSEYRLKVNDYLKCLCTCYCIK